MKKTLTSILIASIILHAGPFNSIAQDQTNLTFGADIVSRYIWRGINLGGPSSHVQPHIEYSAGNTGLALGFWGSQGIGTGSPGAEADIYISYSPFDFFTLTVNDYFFPSEIPFSRDSYFNYKKGETGHTIELMARFNGTPGFPFSLLFAMNVYGADGVDEKGENYNAKYLEIGYSTSLQNTGIEAFAGMALDNPKIDQGAEGWYGNSSGIINLGVTLSRKIQFSEKITIPAFSSIILNPEAGNIFMVIGLSL